MYKPNTKRTAKEPVHRATPARGHSWLTSVALLTLVALPVWAGQQVSTSPDVTLNLSGLTVADEDVITDDGGGVATIDLGLLPANIDVVGYHADGNALFFTPDVTFDLAGVGTIFPRDVVLVDGGSPQLFFKGAGSGVPLGVRVDAVTLQGSDLFLSFDTTVALPGGVTADDEDLVHFDGSDFAMVFDGSDFGVPAALDLDAVHFLDSGELALSFDGSGLIDNIAFDDEDVLVVDGGSNWQMLHDSTSSDPAWAAADLDAVFVEGDVVPGPLFSDGFESGDLSAWTSTVP